MSKPTPTPSVNRRQFVATSFAAGMGLSILPSGLLAGNGPNNRLNVALIGAHGRGHWHWNGLKKENVVALCDVNAQHLALAGQEFPKATQYSDWRKCLEQRDLDAVLIATPDHHHAFIAIWAMNRGLHVYCEKPLGDCVHEAREVRKVYLANKDKLATQHGTQRHQFPNFNRVSEWVRGGIIGELQDVHVWGNRWHDKTDYLPAEGSVPTWLDWEQWIGPVRMHPFNSTYVSGRTGMNCLNWNMYDDFGSWQIGDMGSHVMDLAWNAIDAGLPTSVKASGDPYNPAVCPSALQSIFKVPANDWRGDIRVAWYQGGPMPKAPIEALDLTKIGHGAMFKGTKGVIVSDFRSRMLLPLGKDADMTYYDAPGPEDLEPAVGDFVEDWTRAVKGDLKTHCDFDYAGRMVETLMLGLVAHRAGKELTYDPANGEVTNDAAANAYLRKEYRDGWSLHG